MTTTPRSAAPSPTTHPTDGLAAGVAPGAHLVHWLDASDEPTGGIAALGGKAASLVRLLRAGLPVPPGFVILPAAFEMAAEAGTARLTPEAATQVAAAYDSLARILGEAEPAVAVRSSASAEDLAGASFAGQYDTYLGVRGAGAVLEYAARCAASLWSARAAAYRAQREAAGQSLPEGAMAVVVQALIDADAAGVAFSADPITADARHVIVNGCWGLGQSIVDGEVEGDTWRVERASLAIVQESIGLKATRTAPEPGAPRVPVPEAVQRQPCLAPEQVAEIARLVLRAEQMLGRPADVEWALAGGQIAVLQARPITALQPAAPTAPAEPAAQEAPRGPTPAFPFEWPDLALPAP